MPYRIGPSLNLVCNISSGFIGNSKKTGLHLFGIRVCDGVGCGLYVAVETGVMVDFGASTVAGTQAERRVRRGLV